MTLALLPRSFFNTGLTFAWAVGVLLWSQQSVAADAQDLALEQRAKSQIIVRFKENSQFAVRSNTRALASQRAMPVAGLRHLKSFVFKQSSKLQSRARSRSPSQFEISVLQMEDPSADRSALIKQLLASGEVEYAEADSMMFASVLPDDPEFNILWGLHNTGQSGGTADVDIDAPEAWETFTTGDESVVVAIVDTGIQYDHPDLADNMWRNPGETGLDGAGLDKATNGIDDDLNGYVDDVYGVDCINNDGDPLDDDIGRYHGTHVAGTVGAQGNNDNQVSGVNWDVSLMALKYLGSNGNGITSDAVECLTYVANMKADKGINIKITNNSYGGPAFSQAMSDAIQATQDLDILFVAAAGNDGEDGDQIPQYPASYDLPSIVSVASIDRNANKAFTSNYGLESVDIGAPGVSILSTSGTDDTQFLSGTSMASPHVAGVAALLAAQDSNLTWSQIKGRMMDTAVATPALDGLTVTGGYVNAFDALSCSLGGGDTRLYFEPNTNSEYIRTGQALDFDVGLSACGSPVLGQTVTLSFSNGEPAITLLDDGVAPDTTAADGRYQGAYTPSTEGPVTITITAGAIVRTLDRIIVDVPNYQLDSTHPYSWVESSDGTDVGLGGVDDDGAAVPIGFDFDFYGIAYSTVYAHSNGMLKFGSDVELSFFEFLDLPSPSNPNNFIASLWEDLNPAASGGAIYSKLQGTAPNRRLIIQWNDLLHFRQASEDLPSSVTFQAVLYEGSNDIVLQYQDLTFGDVVYDYAARALIGIEAFDGAEGISYLNQGEPSASSLAEEQAMLFSISGSASRTLNVTAASNGNVSADLGQINCSDNGLDCFGQYALNSSISLTATPAANYQFDSWVGAACDSQTNNVCTLQLDQHQTVSAQFSLIPAIVVAPESGLEVNESGTTASFTMALNRVPSDNVVVDLSSSDLSEASVSPSSLVFTPGQGLAAQTVTVTGLNDDIDDGDILVQVLTAPSQSADSDFNGIDPADVSLITLDDADTAAFVITSAGDLQTSEASAAESFTVRLATEPVSSVTLNVASSDASEGSVDKNSLAFNASNWNQLQTVSLMGVDDLVDDGDIAYQVNFAVLVGSDPAYASLSPAPLNAQNADNDSGALIVTLGAAETTEAGGQSSFTLALASQPQSPVTVAISTNDASEASVSPSSVSFDSTDWNSAKTVTITGVDDTLDDDDVAYSIILAPALSDDPDYSGVSAADINLVNLDNDVSSIVVSQTAITTDESGLIAQFNIRLTATPTHNVSMAVLSSDLSEATVSDANVVFTPGNALVAKTITVTGVDDDELDGSIAYTILLESALSDDPQYNGLDANDVSGSNLDLDIDTDDDGKVDDIDNCPSDYNPAQMNSDFAEDGGDVCDTDDDNDSVLDEDDNCSLDHNPAQKDTDGDDLGDRCDPDSDNDSVFNLDDDDELDPNSCQDLDQDGCDDCSVGTDGFGLLADADPQNDGPDLDNDFICDLGDSDVDGDGVENGPDNCDRVANPDQLDSNQDGIGDLCVNAPDPQPELCVPVKATNDRVVLICL